MRFSYLKHKRIILFCCTLKGLRTILEAPPQITIPYCKIDLYKER